MKNRDWNDFEILASRYLHWKIIIFLVLFMTKGFFLFALFFKIKEIK